MLKVERLHRTRDIEHDHDVLSLDGRGDHPFDAHRPREGERNEDHRRGDFRLLEPAEGIIAISVPFKVKGKMLWRENKK